MIIRNVRKSDYEAIDKLLLQLHSIDVCGRPDMFSPAQRYMTKDTFESLLENKNVFALLAQQGKEILGCCFVSIIERSGMAHMRSAYIDLLVVDEKHRRKGIGKAIFRAVQKQAKKVGAKRIDLTVWGHNQIAERAYRSYGMVPQRCVFEINL